jgi:hypothetical protein
MPTLVGQGRDRPLSGFPAPVDLADTWLAHAAAQLVLSCSLPSWVLHELLEPEARTLDYLVQPRTAPDPDAARLAVLLAALAVEARLNRLLRLRDPDDWHTVAHLAPEEKLSLAPRLLRGVDSVPEHADDLSAAAAELFALRTELLEGADTEPLTPAHARALVETAARICELLARLAGRDDDCATAALVEHAAVVLAPRARTLSSKRVAEPRSDWSWSRDVDFPPDLVGS